MLQKRKHPEKISVTLKLNNLTLSLLVTANFEMFASLNANLLACLAIRAFHTKSNLLGSFSLFTKNGLGLATETLLFTIVTTTSLGEFGVLAFLVLGHFVDGVLVALAGAICFTDLWYVNHFGTRWWFFSQKH